MIKICLTAAAAIGIMTGVSLAQTASTTSTTTTTQPMLSAPTTTTGVAVDSTSQRTIDSNGVTTDKTKTYTSGTVVTPAGDLSTTSKTMETTTVR